MNAWNYISWLQVLPLLLISGVTSEYTMKSVYMTIGSQGLGNEAPCITAQLHHIERNYSGYIYSHFPYNGSVPYKGSKERQNKHCVLLLLAPQNYRIELRSLEFHLNGIPEGDQCNGDSLHTFDYNAPVVNVQLTDLGQIQKQFCGRIASRTLAVSSHNALGLWLYIDGTNEHNLGTGFQLFWTIFRDDPTCARREFRCKSGTCIPGALACDSVPHCSDFSDVDRARQQEFNCANVPHQNLFGALSAAAVVGIGVGSILGCCLLGVVLFVCTRERCNRQRNGDQKSGSSQQLPTYMPPKSVTVTMQSRS